VTENTQTPVPPDERPLSPSDRRQRNRQEMVDAILRNARSIMREEGVAALSLRELARRLRFTVQALYKYYPSKAALYDALFREGTDTFARYWRAALADRVSIWDKLESGIEAAMRFAHDYPELSDLTFSRPVPGFVPSPESMQESSVLVAELDETIAGAIASGEMRSGLLATEVRNLYLAMLDGLTRQHMANEPDTPVGSGRYGSLIPGAVAVFKAAWQPERQ
jgi:AcrR family transcriptional regulator